MPYGKKIILNVVSTDYEARLDELVEAFMRDGVIFVGVLGHDCQRVEDIIDELCVGDGTVDYDMLTSSHPGETLEEVIEFSDSLSEEFSGKAQVVEL